MGLAALLAFAPDAKTYGHYFPTSLAGRLLASVRGHTIQDQDGGTESVGLTTSCRQHPPVAGMHTEQEAARAVKYPKESPRCVDQLMCTI